MTTPLIAPAGSINFTLAFEGLTASRGALLVEISGGEEGERRQLELRTVALAELAAAGGIERIALVSDRREAYTVAGYIYDDTDAAAQNLSIQIEVDASPAANLKVGSPTAMARVARLAAVELPTFAHPTSQTWSIEQMKDPAFRSACRIVGLDESTGSWSAAYVCQALRYLLGDISGSRGFGAGLSAEIISRAFTAERADVIVHQSLDPAHWPPADNLDFTWLIFELPIIPADHLFWMINLLMDRLRPGGAVAVVFTFEHGRMPHEQCDVVKRGDVETFALRLLAQGHSVAQLKFRAALRPLPVGTRTPFGLMVRRAA
ncbi:hypothetical protein ABVV53_15625 [Novosphingobium sp. RD2P27]|uniref:Class I SAM-dependent methyltransferase n=1 Tax=Novosphingobium kalidii TaxID=3230299 RepID=A0ABV2D4S4_9SPHN